MAVRIRLKKMGRKHRPFFRLCAMDARCPRDGRVLEELGYYDPMVANTDARAVLNGERIAYWLGVGAQPSDKAAVLIKKYGLDGTHLEQQKVALEKMKQTSKRIAVSDIPAPSPKPVKKKAEPASTPEESAPAVEAETPVEAVAEAPAADAVTETPSEPEAAKEE